LTHIKRTLDIEKQNFDTKIESRSFSLDITKFTFIRKAYITLCNIKTWSNMTMQNQNSNSEIGGASAKSQSAPQSIVDAFVFSAAFPQNFWRTLRELKELYEKRDLDKKDMLKLKLLAVLLVEQLLGQTSINIDIVLRLMQEYKTKGE